ncbi:MAG: hypothetical protein NC293_02910 [Roseburia sp.]|nr:hypothetical protein [Roseburia sp.]
MKRWKKYSFWFLLAVNLGVGILYGWTWGMIATFLLIGANYKFTSGMKKMLVLDGVLVVSTQVKSWIGYRMYVEELHRTNSEDVGPTIMGMINIVDLIISIFLIMAVMVWAFAVKKKKKQAIVTGGILAAAFLCVFVFIYLIVVPFSYEDSSAIIYNDAQCACNDKYEGMVDFYSEAVVIRTYDGKETVRLTSKELGVDPEQIALGDDFFYVLGDDGVRIVKVDYHAKVVGRKAVGMVGLMTCRDGILFFGNETEGNEPGVIDGYYANRYIAERDFESGEIQTCKADESGVCHVGGEVLYEHEGYFSTNPVIPDYDEENSYRLEAGKELDAKVQTEWTRIVGKMLEQKGLRGLTCDVDEYQEGNVIYGVVNAWDSVLGIPDKKIKHALAYRILCKSKRIEVLCETEDVFMIAATEDCILYQKGKEVWREDRSGKEKKKLAELFDSAYMDLQICGKYLVIDEDEEIRVKWRR